MIAILGAMDEEVTPILTAVGEYDTISYANNKFYLASYKGKQLVIAYSKIGKVNAALTASIMIEKFKADKLLFTGVAGALSEGLKIGDLMYATSLAQHDLDITAFGHPYGYVPGIEVFSKTDEGLNKLAIQVAAKKGLDLKSGVIATGDQFVCNKDKKDWIKAVFKADVVEMEGASVAQVCTQLGVPFFILRAISDEAGGGAEFDFDEFLNSSAKVSADFMLTMVEAL
ncbi:MULTISPECIES: 5'-methylthioadenosine/adenosylhomocysteine nucleosidase [Campylobacter]|mgnify:FL=1|jgi:MTA/SAH nucleosidase|uniref:adenosylhomocysteine nucleosidase n=1 Tax=Campylobacter curvus (strain 525.92) TaxID=360105 RepID=A7H007_CAMC5|nr:MULTISPECIES: 5'-methylthioadenosine/adenosylhomocysteine nucleosidase [Campylobacter]EAU01009.1 multifunctional 5'-methylthioadenosine / S-adenosylhomocysteine nucleosidase / 6-amino-6-deoxyfutalosine hydrolase [Campylobacter curvus 525.92]EJP76407.1 MTA/SAH nucleosidase [Campylobacter sp. FOBRC14]